MENKKITTAIVIGLLIVVGILFKINWDEDNRIKQNIIQQNAEEMAECWKQVAKTGGKCEIRFTYIEHGEILAGGYVEKIDF